MITCLCVYDLFKELICTVVTYCMFQKAHQIHLRSHLGHHTRSWMEDSAHWHIGTVLEHRSSENKLQDPHHYHLNSRLFRHSATKQGCTSYFYTGTGFPGIGDHL